MSAARNRSRPKQKRGVAAPGEKLLFGVPVAIHEDA